MRSRAAAWSLIALWSVALGHLTWFALLGPPPAPEYVVTGSDPILSGTDADARQLYLRKVVYLSQRPRHAWIQVVGHDRLHLYVNGKFLADKIHDGFPVALVADLAPYLQRGRNVLAITAEQSTVGRPPAVAVEGAYVLADGDHALGSNGWRCRSLFERNATWWFAPEFDDRHWPEAVATQGRLWGKVTQPPRAITAAGVGQWITPADQTATRAAFRRSFTVPGRPAAAWLRVTTPNNYRLAINGTLLDQQEESLGTSLAGPPVRQTYDVTPVVREGANALTLLLADVAGPLQLLVDLEVEDTDGNLVAVGTEAGWQSSPGQSGDWLAETPALPEAWFPCVAEAGDLDLPPWQVQRQDVRLVLGWGYHAGQLLRQAGLILLIALITALACKLWGRWVGGAAGAQVACLALVAPTLAIGAAVLATYDPRIARQDVYRGAWVALAVAAAVVQWLVLALVRRKNPTPPAPLPQGGREEEDPSQAGTLSGRLFRLPPPRLGEGGRGGGVSTARLVLALMTVGFVLRLQGIEGVRQWDEVENYNATRAFLEHGFPCLVVHETMPLMLIHTSELQFVPMALATLFFDDDRYVVRFPMVCFSTLVIGLIYLTGRRLFGTPVGLAAAILATFSPVLIGMSCFGRYFSMVQFFTLLTIGLYWKALRGSGPLDRKALWGAALSFIAMFYTWEGAGLIAPGMMLAALVQRRGRLGTVLFRPAVWLAVLTVGLAILAQYVHSLLVKTQFLWYGTSLSDLTLRPMWRYPGAQPWYYVLASSWNQDAFLPVVGLFGAALLAIRHPYRAPLRFLLVIHLITCLLMALTLPGLAWRYIHHMIPLEILLAAVPLVAAGRGLVRFVRGPAIPAAWRGYGKLLATCSVAAVLTLASGMTVQLAELPIFRVEGYGLRVFKFPDFEGPARYLSEHFQEGDVVLATDPFHVNHLIHLSGRPQWRTDFWLATALRFPATIDDVETIPRDRRDGTAMLASQDALDTLFATHRRVWVVAQPERHEVLNDRDVGIYLRQHMEVVYEDWGSVVLFRGDRHRPAGIRKRDEATLHEAQAVFLP